MCLIISFKYIHSYCLTIPIEMLVFWLKYTATDRDNLDSSPELDKNSYWVFLSRNIQIEARNWESFLPLGGVCITTPFGEHMAVFCLTSQWSCQVVVHVTRLATSIKHVHTYVSDCKRQCLTCFFLFSSFLFLILFTQYIHTSYEVNHITLFWVSLQSDRNAAH